MDAFIRGICKPSTLRNQQAILDRCSLRDRAAMRATLDRCLAAQSLHELFQVHYPLAGLPWRVHGVQQQ